MSHSEPQDDEERRSTRFGILGPLEVVRSARRIPVPAPKQQIALATLLLHANRYVSNDQLIGYMWHGSAPNDVRATLHTHIARLRHVLGDGRDGEQLIHTRQHGYLIQVGTAELDLTRFRDLVHRAERAARAADTAEAPLLLEALTLWRGPALADIPSEALQHDHLSRLGEERFQALERWLELALQSGQHERVVAELTTVTAEHPLRERLWAQLMLALYRCGRQAEALRAYRTVASLLREELGIDPGDELRQLHQSILRADPALHLTPPQPAAQQPEPVGLRPRQLPTDMAAFIGRAGQLQALDRLLKPADNPLATQPVRVAAITGTAGVGKTALVVHWAHHAHQHFPDGQLYVDLRGFGPGQPMDPAAALETLLLGLNIPVERIPTDLHARSALLRSALAERRVLLVLDNARDTAQVRPLLPGSDCVVLITSRDQLRSLSVHGDISYVPLGVLSAQESTALLTSIVGTDRARAEPEATTELTRLCAHLPLALRIAAANLTLDHYQSIADYVAELRAGNPLTTLRIDSDGESAIRATLDLSYATLPGTAQAVFQLLGLVPGPDFTPEATAALGGCTLDEARRELDRLAGAHLIHRYAPGRYRFHDLLRLYAAERAREEENPEELVRARQRLYGWYLLSVRAAVSRIDPVWSMLPPPTDPPEVTAATFDDPAAAARWLATEHANLVAAIHQAVSSGPRPAVWLLFDAMRGHFWKTRRMSDWLSCAEAAVAVAGDEGDAMAMAAALRSSAAAHSHQDPYEAISLYLQALSYADEAEWWEGKTTVLSSLANTYWRLGRLDEAARCLEEGMRLDQQTGLTALRATKHINLAVVITQLGRLDSAFDHLITALRLKPDHSGATYVNLGEVCHLLGRFEEALRHLAEGGSRMEKSGNHAGEPYYLLVLTDLHCDLGRYDEALDFGGRALTSSRDIEDRHAEALALSTLGRVHQATGRREQAREHHHRAVELAGADNLFPRAIGLIGLAGTADDHAAAVSFAEQALQISRDRSFRILEGLALTSLADLALAAGAHAQAVRHAGLALRNHRDTGHRLGEARTLRILGNAVPGAAYRKQAAELFDEIGSAEASNPPALGPYRRS
ncbi:BTAD domain-containing putative transcriptional regulator [Nonomuraea sp. NPDC050643]|uniref:AfsR/SARP family transcriptional regulator n=1 Tax=Nonomuraea sp. NPDC050643 TaxID=3155660 RepID=UPI003405E313